MTKKAFKRIIRPIIQKAGLDIIKHNPERPNKHLYPIDIPNDVIKLTEKVKPFTLTNVKRINALINAVRYIINKDIQGSFVECGVWKGGSVMIIAHILMEMGATDRDIFLYDTFTGMCAPTSVDIGSMGDLATETFETLKTSNDTSTFCFSPLEEVKKNVLSIGYPKDKIHFIKGKVEDTLPHQMPGEIALLRLDTDWYESTKHDLIHLYPEITTNGVLIIDDYGDWEGARKATDEYIEENNLTLLLNRIDDSLRLAIKTG